LPVGLIACTFLTEDLARSSKPKGSCTQIDNI
jgi:hypothetical protein